MSFTLLGAVLGLGGTFLDEEIELTAQSLMTAVGSSLSDQPQLAEQWKKRIDDHVRENGKFMKHKIAYLPFHPPPVFWEYTCASCRVFNPRTKTCDWVNEWGFPHPGIIHPLGWCAIWMPVKNEEPLEYLNRKPAILTEDQLIFP